MWYFLRFWFAWYISYPFIFKLFPYFSVRPSVYIWSCFFHVFLLENLDNSYLMYLLMWLGLNLPSCHLFSNNQFLNYLYFWIPFNFLYCFIPLLVYFLLSLLILVVSSRIYNIPVIPFYYQIIL